MLESWRMVVLSKGFSRFEMLKDRRSTPVCVSVFVRGVGSALFVVGACIVLLALIEVARHCEGVGLTW